MTQIAHQNLLHAPLAQLLQALNGKDKAVLERAMAMKQGENFDFADSYGLIFAWCRDNLQTV